MDGFFCLGNVDGGSNVAVHVDNGDDGCGNGDRHRVGHRLRISGHRAGDALGDGLIGLNHGLDECHYTIAVLIITIITTTASSISASGVVVIIAVLITIVPISRLVCVVVFIIIAGLQGYHGVLWWVGAGGHRAQHGARLREGCA